MQIASLTNNIDPRNGWGRYASDLIQGVRKNGHDALILKEIDDGFEGVVLNMSGWHSLTAILKIRRFLRDYDIIHALDGYPYAVLAVLANLGLGKKIVVTAVGTYSVAPLYNKFSRVLLRCAFGKADKIVAISRYTRDAILKKISREDVIVINPGIDFDKFYGDHIDSSEQFILSVGALKHRKGYHVSIPAFASAKWKLPGIRYKIVGNQSSISYFTHLKELAKKFNVENDVEFIQEISDEELRQLYQKASLFVLTSVNEVYHFEGYGLVFLEAAAAGLPVIGTLDNGIEDAVSKNNSILVPQNDIIKTSAAMVTALSNPDLWQSMSRAGYQWAKEHDLINAASRYLSVYNEIVK